MKNPRNVIVFALCMGVTIYFGRSYGEDEPDTGAESGVESFPLEEDAALTISNGEPVEIDVYLQAGHRTVIEFTAGWCEGSRQFGERLDAALHRHRDLRVRTIDIDQWGSEVANQYDIHKLPAAWLFDGDELVTDDYREVLRILER